MSNPFNATTAEAGSRWRCRNGQTAEFRTTAMYGGEEVAVFHYVASGVVFVLMLNGRVSNTEDCGGDIIAPEPEAKPAVPRRDRYRNRPDYVPQVGDVVRKVGGILMTKVQWSEGGKIQTYWGGGIHRDPADFDLIRAAGEQPGEGEVVMRRVSHNEDGKWMRVEAITCAMTDELLASVRVVNGHRSVPYEAALRAERWEFKEEANKLRSELASLRQQLHDEQATHQTTLEMVSRGNETIREIRQQLEAVTAENFAIRELMNCYNLGGWTDALAPMTRALKAESDLASRDETIKRLEGELAACRKAWGSENDEICQRLGKVLGYPWFKDDQKNFPGSTEEHGVCVGDHVGVTLVMEGARKIADLQSDNARLTADLSAARERVTVLEGAAKKFIGSMQRRLLNGKQAVYETIDVSENAITEFVAALSGSVEDA